MQLLKQFTTESFEGLSWQVVIIRWNSLESKGDEARITEGQKIIMDLQDAY